METLSHILIADDDPDIRKVLGFLLKDKYSLTSRIYREVLFNIL